MTEEISLQDLNSDGVTMLNERLTEHGDDDDENELFFNEKTTAKSNGGKTIEKRRKKKESGGGGGVDRKERKPLMRHASGDGSDEDEEEDGGGGGGDDEGDLLPQENRRYLHFQSRKLNQFQKLFSNSKQRTKSGAAKPRYAAGGLTKTVVFRPFWTLRRCIAFLAFLLLTLLLGSILYMVIAHREQQTNGAAAAEQTRGEKGAVRKFCDSVEIEPIWSTTVAKLNVESAIRLVDVNEDGVLDAIVGFGTGAARRATRSSALLCDMYFNKVKPCFGGVMALDGASGKEIWRLYGPHREVLTMNCRVDLDRDGVPDCVAAGRASTFFAVSSKHGALLWKFNPRETTNTFSMNVYGSQYLSDLNGDGTPEIVAAYGGDPRSDVVGKKRAHIGLVMIVDGRNGKVLRQVKTPDELETNYPPQVMIRRDGSEMVLIGTGAETQPGSLWMISSVDLYQGRMERAKRIFTDQYKGVMTPGLMVDLTNDGIEDIVMASFNGNVVAFDGESFKLLWNTSFPSSEALSPPAIGYFNNDSIPDFIVHYHQGPAFPVYYRSVTTVLDGRNGKTLLAQPIVDSVGAQSAPLTINLEGYGNDLFLYWIADCEGHEGKGGQYTFIPGTSKLEKLRADSCRLRFNSDGFSQFVALNRLIKPPGIVLYDSRTRYNVEHSNWINTSKEAIDFVNDNPEYLEYYLRLSSDQDQSSYSDVASDEDYDSYDGSNARKTIHRYPRDAQHHTDGGLQKILSTGTLAPVLSKASANANRSIDILFATYWVYPSRTLLLTPEDEECIRKKMERGQEDHDSSKYYGFDPDSFEQMIAVECLRQNGRSFPSDGVDENDDNPFDVPMGTMTVNRFRLTCRCTPSPNKACANIVPFRKQDWAGFLGSDGRAHSRLRPR